MALEEQPVHLGHLSLIPVHWKISFLFLGSGLPVPLPKAFIAVPGRKRQKISTLGMCFPQTVVTQVCSCKATLQSEREPGNLRGNNMCCFC